MIPRTMPTIVSDTLALSKRRLGGQVPAFAGMTGSLLPLVPRGRLFLCRPAVVAGIAFVAERLPAAIL